MNDIRIGNHIIGEGHPVLIIAELACEHRGKMADAKRLIDAAKEAGADIAKFQLHVPREEMVAGSIRFWAGSMDEILKEVNFETQEQHAELKSYCESVGITYLCTPFCSAAADIVEKVGVVGYKTGSGELTNLPMLRHIAEKGKPMIVSTGMSTMEEIADAVGVLRDAGAEFMLMHALSEYPASYENMNLRLIEEIRSAFGIHVGFSDHSRELYAPVAAVTLGARVIEKHFTLRELHGPDDLVSLDPSEFREMVTAIRNTEKALGSKRYVSEKEAPVRGWAHHSVVVSRPIQAGETFTYENLCAKRPGSGISAKYLDRLHSSRLIGHVAARPLAVDDILTWEDVQ
jgi:N,N'-diacetyllegionaminate synthase